MATAFITGATGQDGSYLCESLTADGWTVHALVHSEDSSIASCGAIETHVGDLADAQRLRALVLDVAPDVIFNLGGISSVAFSWDNPVLTGQVTGMSVATLLDASWELHKAGAPVRFVQASSSEIFGVATTPTQTESTPLNPVSPYGAAKAYAQHLVRLYRGRGLFAASAILYNHESPRRPLNFVTRKITHEVARIAEGESTSLVLGALDVERDWGWAPDYVDAIRRIASADQPDDFIVATGEAHTIREFVGAAFGAVGIEEWERFVSTDPAFIRPVETPVMIGDSSKIRIELGWKPEVEFAELVRRMVDNDLQLMRGAHQ